LAGKTLGHCVLEAEAGTGGLGAVYRAYDSRLRRPVAIKVLHEDLRQGTGWEQILAEARGIHTLAEARDERVASPAGTLRVMRILSIWPAVASSMRNSRSFHTRTSFFSGTL